MACGEGFNKKKLTSLKIKNSVDLVLILYNASLQMKKLFFFCIKEIEIINRKKSVIVEEKYIFTFLRINLFYKQYIYLAALICFFVI